MKLIVGEQAPDFTLKDQDGNMHRLEDYRGKYLLVYFYPKDFTLGCTKEACNFRDAFPHFRTDNFEVVGISTDSVESHKKFAEKYQLPFTLLADTEKTAVNNYDVWHPKKFMGKEYWGTLRTSFLIDPKGKISKIYEKVNPLIHAMEVEKDIASL